VEEGEGAFYGPKIDVHIKDAVRREWQCSTIQCDFNLPQRFDMKYTDDQGELQIPILLHRAIFGSLERFVGILIEHYEGKFPLWLSPIQVRILPLTPDNIEYSQKIAENLKEEGFRVEVDSNVNRLGKKIKLSEEMNVPYQIMIGREEEVAQAVSLRNTFTREETKGITVNQLVQQLKELVNSKT